MCQSVPVPRFEPFRGARYDTAAVRMDEVIAPPYDVVGPDERARLASRSPFNAIHLELPEPDPATGDDRYAAAARLLADWVDRGVVREEAARAFYLYRMTAPDGTTTTGVLGALGIDDDVLPHEETMPKPKSDRLDLLRATRTNLSPIWGLSLATGLGGTLRAPGPPAARAHDDDGVRHELWVLDDPATVAAVRDAVGTSPVVIADGHHRYETARTYRAEVRRASGGQDGAHDLVMAFVVELAESELHVRAIHRVVSGLGPVDDPAEMLGRSFHVERVGPATDAVVESAAAPDSATAVTAGGTWRLRVRTGAFEEAGTDLLAGLVDLALGAVPGASLAYEAEWGRAAAAVRGGEAQLAVLLPPVTVPQISAWARARRRMPPKTTYFSPKPRTGMVFRMLTGPPR